MSEVRFQVSSEQSGERLDKLVAAATGVSRRIARTYIATGRVRVDRRVVRILTRPIRGGAEVSIEADGGREPASAERGVREAERGGRDAQRGGRDAGRGTREAGRSTRGAPGGRPGQAGSERRLDERSILYCDKHLLVLDKPANLLTEHDRFGSPSLEELAPGLLAARGERGAVWLVHRLDAGTSGVIVLARSKSAVAALSEDFREGEVRKTYVAICQGALTAPNVVDAPIARAERTRHAVNQSGKPALTVVTPLRQGKGATLVSANPKTGRTHQIRVHLSHLGHPLFGDRLYGGPMYTDGRPPLTVGRPMLHALRLEVTHPKTGEAMTFAAPPPPDFAELLARLGLSEPEIAWDEA